jgi:predicted peptidase
MKDTSNEPPPRGSNPSKMRLMQAMLRARWVWRQIMLPWADQKEKEIVRAVGAFKQFTFTDPKTGLTLKYNLYTPRNY